MNFKTKFPKLGMNCLLSYVLITHLVFPAQQATKHFRCTTNKTSNKPILPPTRPLLDPTAN